MQNGFNISFEFFPPKTAEAETALLNTAQQLCHYQPEYFSVTFGAGGATQVNTPKTVFTLKDQLKINTAPHISCIDSDKQRVQHMLEHYQSRGIRQLVALRGDIPEGQANANSDFRYAADLVEFIRIHHADNFDIYVAIYPEAHPETPDPLLDLQHFKNKVNAGATSAITQYFFNLQAFENLLENCAKLNIQIPITPGIMPITNYKQLTRFSSMCGAEIPRWIRLRLESYGDDMQSIRSFGAEVVTKLCESLLQLDVPGLHFYTLNKADACHNILQNLALD